MKRPTSFDLRWTANSVVSAKHFIFRLVGFWRPVISLEDYVCLGDVVGHYDQPPPLDSVLCARTDLVRKNLMGYPVGQVRFRFIYYAVGYPEKKSEELKNNYNLRNLFVEFEER